MQHEAWPSGPEAARIVVQFRNMPVAEQRRKMLSQEGFLRQRAAKLEDQLRRAERENRDLSMSLLVHKALASGRLPIVGIDDAAGVAWATELKLKEVRERINKEAAGGTLSSAPAPVVEPVDMAMESMQASTWFDGNGAFGEELIMPMPYTNHVGDAWIKVNAPINARELVPLSYVDHGNNANWQMENIDGIGGEEIFPVTYADHANNVYRNYGINGEEVMQMPYAGEHGNIRGADADGAIRRPWGSILTFP